MTWFNLTRDEEFRFHFLEIVWQHFFVSVKIFSAHDRDQVVMKVGRVSEQRDEGEKSNLNERLLIMRNISLAHFSTLGKMGQTRSSSHLLHATSAHECVRRRRVVADVVHLAFDYLLLMWLLCIGSKIAGIKQVSKLPHWAYSLRPIIVFMFTMIIPNFLNHFSFFSQFAKVGTRYKTKRKNLNAE